MAKQTAAGAVIIDRIRERITSGRYLGSCRPGQRLPSIREVAHAEGVNRKTVAAAYLRLQDEGLVQVRARSGIYLAEEESTSLSSPLDRLHRRWLGQTVTGARALGLESSASLKLLAAVASVEQAAIPVLECNRVEGAAIAEELSRRLGIRAVPILLSEFRRSEAAVASTPILVTTPWHVDEVADIAPGAGAIVEVTIANALGVAARRMAASEDGFIVTGSDTLASKIRRALAYGAEKKAKIGPVVAVADEIQRQVHAGRRRALIWPGTPAAVQSLLPRDVELVRPKEMLSEASVERVQGAILDAALRLTRSPTAGGDAGDGPAPLSAVRRAPLTATRSRMLPQRPQ